MTPVKLQTLRKICFESYPSCYIPTALSPAEWTVWVTGVPSLEQLLRFPSNGLLGLNPCPLGWKLGEISLLPELPGLELEFDNCNRNTYGFIACYYQILELLFIAHDTFATVWSNMFLKWSTQLQGIITNMSGSLISFTEHFMDGTLHYSQFEKMKFQVGFLYNKTI